MGINWYTLEQQIDARMKDGHVPGFALAIVQEQKVVYAHGFGLTAMDPQDHIGTQVTPQTLFRIGSVTKTLTGVAIMRLVEAGRLDLDVPVKTYVPWLEFREAGAADTITLRMLLSHTSGLISDWEYPGRRDPQGLEAYVRTVLPQLRFIAPPGKLYSYSGPGINLVGYIAEVVSKRPYTQLMQELVFDPLEMKHTTFDPLVAMTYSFAQSHDLAEDGTVSVQHRYVENTGQYPESYANSTVVDMANFCVMLLNQGRFGNTQILSLDSIQEMQRVQADQMMLEPTGYGLTLGLKQYKGIRLIGHGGLMGSHWTQFETAPDFGIAVIGISNRWSPEFASGEFINGIFDQMLQLSDEKAKLESIQSNPSSWKQYQGIYLGDFKGFAEIQVHDQQLVLDWNGEVIPLNALKEHFFYGQRPGSEQNVAVKFLPEETEPVQFIIFDGEPCRRIPAKTIYEPNTAVWAGYSGLYQTDFFTLRIDQEESRLVAILDESGEKFNLIPLNDTLFASQTGMFEFIPNQNGEIEKLLVGGYVPLRRVARSV